MIKKFNQMETYKNFIQNKSAEELQHTTEQHQIILKNLETELNFYEFLLDSCRFKSPVINLFEKLVQFKIDIASANIKRGLLLREIDLIIIKIEHASFKTYDLIIDELEELGVKIYNFHEDITHLKFEMYEYLKSVVRI